MADRDALDAEPEWDTDAPSTYTFYKSVLNCHLLGKPRRQAGNRRKLSPAEYAVQVAKTQARCFNEPHAPRAWREQMRAAGVPAQTRLHAWRVLSSVLSWAARSPSVPEIHTNGCKLAREPIISRRRSACTGGTGYTPAKCTRPLPSWALSPQAVEAIRAHILSRAGQREAILAHRDATVVSLQYGLASRNQELRGLRWSSLDGEFAWITEVLSNGQLQQWGKTEHSTQRRTAIPGILRDDLEYWRQLLTRSGHPARDSDFIVPGDLTHPRHGVRETETGACHLSKSQAKTWGAECFTPAVQAVAQRPEFARILGATPYALRRGGISLRLHTEDPQTVASECGTSLKMLSDHYSFPIEDLRQQEPRPADVEWRAARAESHRGRDRARLYRRRRGAASTHEFLERPQTLASLTSS